MMKTFWILLMLLLFVQCQRQYDDARLQLIIDADTANEVDDLFAIVRAILEPNFKLHAISSAQFHTSPIAGDTSVLKSQKLNKEIIQLMDRSDIHLPVGSNSPLTANDKPAKSQASYYIIDKAHQMKANQTLHIAVLGPCTNVASAILQDSSIIPKLSVHYIGFWHDPETNIYDKKEFNTGNDPIATDVLLNTEGLDLNVMTATISQHLVFEKINVDKHLIGKGGIADYLADRWDNFERHWTDEDEEKTQWIMWDVAIIEALAKPWLASKETFTTPEENTQRYIEAYVDIEVEDMIADFWSALNSYLTN